MIELEQAAQNVVDIARWLHPKYGMTTTPFPWRVESGYWNVTIVAADGQVLISDATGECDPAFWGSLVATLNTLAQVMTGALPEAR